MAKDKNIEAAERRTSRRIEVALALMVRGKDKHGEAFEDTTQSYNLSREGASFRTIRELVLGQELKLAIPRRPGSPQRDNPTYFETTGEVRRITSTNEGEWEIGVHFTGPRLRTYMSESA